MIEIEINNEAGVDVDCRRLDQAIRNVMEAENVRNAQISMAIVDNACIRQLNRRYLGHDYATDVLSFLLERGDEHLDGEIIVSADTAAAKAPEFGWSSADELLLYVIHGALHLVGYDDRSDDERKEMRAAEQRQLERFRLNAGALTSEHRP